MNSFGLKNRGGRPRIHPIGFRPSYEKKQIVDAHQFLNPSQINQLMAAASNQKEKMLIFLGVRTGKRLSEILSLKYGDINFDEDSIDFNILKKKKRVPIYYKKKIVKWKWIKRDMRVTKYYPDEVMQELWRYTHKVEKELTLKEESLFKKDEYLFQQKRENRKKNIHMTRQSVDKMMKKLGKKTGIIQVGSKKIHYHLLRHTYAVWFARIAETPLDIATLKDNLDHSRTETTMEYLKFNKRLAVKDINEMYKANPINKPSDNK